MMTDYDESDRRLGRLAISSHLIGQFFADGPHAYFVKASGIPASARVIGCEWDFNRQAVVLFFEDMGETTPMVSPGSHPTDVNPILRDLTHEDLIAMRTEGDEDWADAHLAKTDDAPYGYCPVCGARGDSRERSPSGKTYCENGHGYPSTQSVETEPKSR